MGGSNTELSRIDYLRNKYGKLISEQVNNRINLRGAVNNEIDRLYNFMVYVVRSGKKLKPRGLPMPRCPHCEYITDGASYFPEVLKYGK